MNLSLFGGCKSQDNRGTSLPMTRLMVIAPRFSWSNVTPT